MALNSNQKLVQDYLNAEYPNLTKEEARMVVELGLFFGMLNINYADPNFNKAIHVICSCSDFVICLNKN